MKITEEQYNQAIKTIFDYHYQNKKITIIKELPSEANIALLKLELIEYFKTSDWKLEEFDLKTDYGNINIIPIKPYYDECYEGQIDDDIENIGNKYRVKLGFVSWMYHQ